LAAFLAELVQSVVEAVQVGQSLAEQGALGCSELARQCTLQLRALAAPAALGHVGDQTRIRNSTYECFQPLAAGCAEDVAGHIAELDTGAFERLLNAAALG